MEGGGEERAYVRSIGQDYAFSPFNVFLALPVHNRSEEFKASLESFLSYFG